MKKIIVCTLILLAWFSTIYGQAGQSQWTILNFLSADNNLDGEAIDNFIEMAGVGSTDSVSIVVELDRAKDAGNRKGAGAWSETLRFRVAKGMKPTRTSALACLGEENMGSPQALCDFVVWGMNTYPADHYALIVWSHGEGYRYTAVDSPSNPSFRLASLGVVAPAYKSVSIDQSAGDKLYMKEVQDALAEALDGRKLDIIGFDACLMGMVENVYAMRNFADVFIGSEDLIPAAGWNYTEWLRALIMNPGMDACSLAKAIVGSYANRYSHMSIFQKKNVTLSAIRLQDIESFAGAISETSDTLIARIDSYASVIGDVRKDCLEYASSMSYFYIDFGHFVTMLSKKNIDENLHSLLRDLMDSYTSLIICNFSNEKKKGEVNSTGLSIYFPSGRSVYNSDLRSEEGYEKQNLRLPVEFVQKERWADFLHAYYMIRE